MTQQTRDELLTVLTEVAKQAPDVRFGQLITNLAYMAEGPSQSAAWDVEDDRLLEAARRLLARLESRETSAAVGTGSS
jgi:hypothetical protein